MEQKNGRKAPVFIDRILKLVCVISLTIFLIVCMLIHVLNIAQNTGNPMIQYFMNTLLILRSLTGVIGFLSLFGIILFPEKYKVQELVAVRLYDPKYGNPLSMTVDQGFPKIKVRILKQDGLTRYITIRIETISLDIEKLMKSSNIISSAFVGKYRGFTVVKTSADESGNYVEFRLKNIDLPHKLTYKSVSSLIPPSATKLKIQDDIGLDLRYSGSMIFAAKTRSGKTTAVISMLIQLAMLGPDEHGSRIVIVDPKRAELSRLPTVLSPNLDDGKLDAHNIINAIRNFRDLMIDRQSYLNTESELKGDAVHWWDANMNPSVLFIDEFAVLRTLLPSRASKDEPEYSLPSFEKLLTQVMTMGSSAGCFVIVSVAQAGADQISTMLRNAFMTKVLLRPTVEEARFLWSPGQLNNFVEQDYKAGDAIMTVADGTHESNVVYVQFPKMEFPVYRELGRLLRAYERPK